MVVARTLKQSVRWISREFPELQTTIYTVDDDNSALRIPKNKGNEAMVYISYIIDNYDMLPDIVIFAHAHPRAWHSDKILGHSTSTTIKRLNGAHVVRQGYVNLRCQWDPGCPGRTLSTQPKDSDDIEMIIYRQAWNEIRPESPVPKVIGQPCGGQFAASRSRIRATPQSQWEFYRTWLMTTNLTDHRAGRVWEYMWQVVLTGQAEWCPEQASCYCESFGVCFGSWGRFQGWEALEDQQKLLMDQLLREEGSSTKSSSLREEIDAVGLQMKQILTSAIQAGDRYVESLPVVHA
ncbi:hypothetical protein QQZ08_001838 [Neonectria magnoliae]|uniref:Uncharacterized protein n=1 Tax=Neonectria magnoliae TaxID=2732573 RepID=A0ABR1IEG8_9HYPO